MPSTFTPGKSVISLIALITTIAPYLADWNETHIYNPNWPPHARYHNGQTMSMGLFTGLITLYVLHFSRSTFSPDVQIANLTWICVLHTVYYGSSLSGILYPGAQWMDPEFGEGSPQLYGFPVLIGIVWIGWALEKGRIARVSSLKET
ncbi:hypothetical protein HBI56_092240 [Parastagonospora nodorum]|uniref:Uncharacterized protein n=2 Tax=Phaeosphaeria nodorum (strain SN15 / ATCC MYA-4574 / FGSC 10173) TaxID=321614 RepID=A0A7U2I147_PHANO|nr:hypothetical protein SNOG_04098 [Parastagonospora nodorum SN15]KAH3914308.1 hypothetical protein HBH56_087640 [Parastagonospora nodorum]EAT87858.1 hypothetical protein SNOG_04098 [Parastagonospora nodorum SN15]KAH3936438.1 hypothetical protein HBH54_022280 [Parastagonospora nodorum]KAH3945765.1 hypothetical protein HBH53_139390 [Parastagonospora nodorum]KAH3966367.1 hypothetical protein HBH51_145960 [Parastagonospora nodorum]